MKVHVVKPTRFLFACLAQVWLQEAIRHAEEIEKAEKKAKETAMHSIPFVKMESEECLGLLCHLLPSA
jgi:predicted CoA-binding protein